MKYVSDDLLPSVSASEFAELRAEARPFTLCILRRGSQVAPASPEATQRVAEIIYAHGMRNARLLLAGIMPIICPVSGDTAIAGSCILDCSVDEARQIMSLDPAVQAKVLTFDLYPTASWPGSALPGPAPRRSRRTM